MLPDLNTKDVDVESLAGEASEDEGLLSGLVAGLSAKQERVGYNCLRALLLVGEEHPQLLYPHWDLFAELLRSENTYFKLRGANLIATIICVDTENRFEGLFDEYYELLDGRSVIAAAYIAGNSGKIARAKPALESKIRSRLFSIEDTHHPPQRRDLIKGRAVEAFGEYFEVAKEKGQILEFVRRQLQADSPRTRREARKFLERWEDSL